MLLYGYMRGIKVNTESTNSLVLAYLGDSVYELLIREYFIKQNISKVNINISKIL
jgi:23S rRNA maturation mini-RNase III